jgi:ankyrin repeat protein
MNKILLTLMIMAVGQVWARKKKLFDMNSIDYLAEEPKHLGRLKELIAQGKDIHEHNERALAVAAYLGNVEAVKVLIEAGADINVNVGLHPKYRLTISYVNPILEDAITSPSNIKNKVEIVELLCKAGAIVTPAVKKIVTQFTEFPRPYGYNDPELAKHQQQALINILSQPRGAEEYRHEDVYKANKNKER